MSTPHTCRYRFRSGALDNIMRTRNLQSDEQLAVAIGVWPEDIAKLRAGYKVSPELAVRVCALQGDRDYIAGYFDRVDDEQAAA